jgi:hypothetical protein
VRDMALQKYHRPGDCTQKALKEYTWIIDRLNSGKGVVARVVKVQAERVVLHLSTYSLMASNVEIPLCSRFQLYHPSQHPSRLRPC